MLRASIPLDSGSCVANCPCTRSSPSPAGWHRFLHPSTRLTSRLRLLLHIPRSGYTPTDTTTQMIHGHAPWSHTSNPSPSALSPPPHDEQRIRRYGGPTFTATGADFRSYGGPTLAATGGRLSRLRGADLRGYGGLTSAYGGPAFTAVGACFRSYGGPTSAAMGSCTTTGVLYQSSLYHRTLSSCSSLASLSGSAPRDGGHC